MPMPLKESITALITPLPSAEALTLGIDYFRERLLFCLLLALGGFGAIAYLPSVYYGFIYRFYSVILIDTLALAWVFYLLVRRNLTFTFKAIGLLAVFYILGIWLLVVLGPTGAGFMWMLLFSIMAGVLLGFRPAMVSFGINFVTTVLLSILVYTQTIAWELIHADAMAIWTVKGVNFLCINAIVSVSTGFLITKITWMATEEQQRRKALSREMQARLRAEKEKKELTIRLYQSQKMEAMGTLAGGVAHDFNNILSAIMGYTELSLMDPDLPETIENNLNHIIRASERAKGISHQILTFSRHASVDKGSCDMGRIADECLDLFKVSLSADISLERHIPERPFPVYADKTQITQVIMNLLTNSRQALGSADGQKGQIRVSLDWATENDLKDQPSQASPVMALRVADTGRGIPKDLLPRVFEPYFTTKKTSGGTGMGLSISHGIIKEHGGEIRVESTPEKGAVFTVLLPTLTDAEEPPPPVAAPGTGGDEHILMVDDESHILTIHQQILSDLGYQIRAYTDPVEALDAVRADPEGQDLVITDRKMEGISGIELNRRLSEVAPDLPVILCTGFPEAEDEKGFDAVLLKPVSGSKLAVTVRQVLDRRS
jgi:signal transduction histidine kinase